MLALLACGHPPIEKFEPTARILGKTLIVGIDTDLPDDAVVNMTVARYFGIEADLKERPMTVGGHFNISVGELRNGTVGFDLEAEGEQFYGWLQRRIPHNPEWGRIRTLARHHVAMIYSPDEGPLKGSAIAAEGNDWVRGRTDFYWGRTQWVK